MKVALVDNGSLDPAGHEALRAAAAAVGAIAGIEVEAVSWRHSNRIARGGLAGGPASVLEPWVRGRVAEGETQFVIVPYFISPRGAIGSSLRADLDALRASAGPFQYSFTDGLDEGSVLEGIVADLVREAAAPLHRPAVIVVDHGGPSRASAQIRDRVAGGVRSALGAEIGPVLAASMESPGGDGCPFNRPLLAEALRAPGFNEGDVVIAPLFLSPGRHAGPGGDLARLAGAAQAFSPRLRCRFARLVGAHTAAAEFLAQALQRALCAATAP
jgi:sirohydrochlorin ferrochelatase